MKEHPVVDQARRALAMIHEARTLLVHALGHDRIDVRVTSYQTPDDGIIVCEAIGAAPSKNHPLRSVDLPSTQDYGVSVLVWYTDERIERERAATACEHCGRGPAPADAELARLAREAATGQEAR